MIYLAIALFVVAAISFFLRWVPISDGYESKAYPKAFTITSGIVGAMAVVFLCLSVLRIVDSGQVGVKRLFGRVYLDQPLSEGLHCVNPFLCVEAMSIRTEVYTMSSVSSEGQVQGDDSIIAISSDDLKCPRS